MPFPKRVNDQEFTEAYHKCKTAKELADMLDYDCSYINSRLRKLKLAPYSRPTVPSSVGLAEGSLSSYVKSLRAKREAIKRLDAKKLRFLKDLEANRANLCNDVQELKKKITLNLGL